jgi:hypothetical protein
VTLAILIPTGVAISSFVMVTSLEIQPSGARTGVKPAALVAARTWRSAASSGTGSTSTSIMNTAIICRLVVRSRAARAGKDITRRVIGRKEHRCSVSTCARAPGIV